MVIMWARHGTDATKVSCAAKWPSRVPGGSNRMTPARRKGQGREMGLGCDMWCPQIKEVTHVSRRRPGVSGRVVISDKPGEAGEETYPACQAACQATNGPDGENPIEQVERLASCVGSHACSRACVYFSTETGTCLGTSCGTRCYWVYRSHDITASAAPGRRRCPSVLLRCQIWILPFGVVMQQSRLSADIHDARIRQSGSIFSPFLLRAAWCSILRVASPQ